MGGLNLLKHFALLKKVNFSTSLVILMAVNFIILWVVWPLPKSIAARNIALYFGALSSTLWIIKNNVRFSFKQLTPIFLLLLVIFWILILYFFSPQDPDLQLGDIKGTWLRALLGIIFALGLAKSLEKNPKYWNVICYPLFLWPAICFLMYFYRGYSTGEWYPYGYKSIFKSKIAAVFFLTWSLALLFSYLHYLIGSSNKKNKSDIKFLSLMMLPIVCILCAFFFINSLNGFILIFIGLVLLILIYLSRNTPAIHSSKSYSRLFICMLLVLSFSAGIVLFDKKYASGKLTLIPNDIAFIVFEDETGAWKWDGKYTGLYPPLNPRSGLRVNDSTYERVSWFLEGLRILKSHPLGLGYSHRAFAYYMSNFYPGSRATKTHSGWLDLALGVGVISLFFIWTAIAIVMLRSWFLINKLSNKKFINYYIFWALFMMLVLWQFGELSEREYLEVLFASIAFFSIVISQPKLANDER